MKVTNISFKNTGFFSKAMIDYLEQSPKLQPFYGNFPNIEGFKNQLEQKRNFSNSHRKTLVSVLKNQYKNSKTSEATQQNIEILASENTFTVTTGHQLNLFTGPLYFLYKIVSTINLCEELQTQFPKENFVPVYWMATEDHDFEEINFFNFDGKKVQWNSHQTGGVGRFSTEGLDHVLEVFSEHLGTSKNAEYLTQLFREAYIEHNNLAEATRYIANELFGSYGLVIVDGDDSELKREFIPYVTKELTEQFSFKNTSKTIKSLEEDYKIQVNPREINLFYLTDILRERIVLENGFYKVNDTEISWSLEELKKEINDFPERFSPNVILRPLYQEVILPNLCYIGGGGELAYWLELKSVFEEAGIPFPILLLRNSVQVVSEKQAKKLRRLELSIQDIFIKQNTLIQQKVLDNSENKVDFTQQKQFLKEQFEKLSVLAEKTDVSFIGAVKAQERKQQKGLDNLEKRWLRAEKRRQKDLVDRITLLQNEILPNQSLEERQRNFSEYYLEYGVDFIKVLKENLHPLQLKFTILEL
ncbi:bacillithiol biosynthesis cysteine-adding enzyme BshC [Tenacibaculum caenipelagi]|uniref:Putative cysteine ligase BshC n=1 Tax=Tenacibaculum caenipelagi TaxID=1325435 RepID=A0A4R6TNR3_9FLAO|nr:bacillithiol biosynthesis cysteine-adding enzyme BshC [Tenacibaculum caenipelagi]TDQ29919.1 bacillithiol biosynthesis cysteine-adding enzyme BshC [Tenacibaculum caenipelagi]